MADLSQTALKEPEQMDWDNYNPTSSYRRPPTPVGPDGKYRVFFGQAPKEIKNNLQDPDLFSSSAEYLTFLLDPITLVKSGPDADGYTIRFARASVKKFTSKKTGEPIDASMVGNYLRACQSPTKPQRNMEYIAAVGQTRGKVFPLTLDWSGYAKDTGEQIVGYENFPDDPERPGEKKAIITQGEVVQLTDNRGNPVGAPTPLKAEVLFANAKLRYFSDPKRLK